MSGIVLCKCGAYQLRNEQDSMERGQYATEHHSFTQCWRTPLPRWEPVPPTNEIPRCGHPDRHEPRLVCGYPLPCPHHTVVVETRGDA